MMNRLFTWNVVLSVVACTILSSSVVGGQTSADSDSSQLSRFVLGVGDVLSISVWKNPELAAQVPVRPDGNITVPLVGEVYVAGQTPLEVQQALTQRFEDFVTAPAVSVVVGQINSLKIYIVGEVGSPGVYDILQPTNLLQALAMAGGFNEYANKNSVVLLRLENGTQRRRLVNVKDIISGKDIGANLLLKPGDTIVVP